ncbi:polyphosphate:AMP phosphotransferase [Haliangium ochraceum]|uniref:Polyphosphate kinase-2-related domain-containing protein n=1 Tax=Haliangium ochraceum (strain DSM 14365 / JCM 11303 / SMP-2) TaxID=502025 RepID=D0LKM1_HALO1|nr:polyphosphate:AMP phosphotransferase [Haliangium ochraceum]ACY15069.1 protein of unknown function DUF344 [Haliangium ochraceum DSM 14365]
MFESAELTHELSKSEREAQEPELRLRLLEAQQALREAEVPVLLVIAGVEGAGKGDTVNLLHAWMDPRHLKTYASHGPTEAERAQPPFWRFWMSLPRKGQICLYFDSWYSDTMQRAAQGELEGAELASALTRINTFERELSDDGALIIKLWFHLGKKQQRQRFEALESKKSTRWRVTKRDWALAEAYDDLRPIWERTLHTTSTGVVPWTIIPGADPDYREVTAARHVAERIADHLEKRAQRAELAALKPALIAKTTTILDKLDLEAALDKQSYEHKLAKWQGRLNRLSRKAQKHGVAAIALFEGWDAAGKGGAIRRITRACDARYYRVIRIGAPTEEERDYPYLWRFWRHLPRPGSLTIFDRSWYGRLLVERVEGFARPDEWMRAYHEIGNFEERLTANGIALAKFWLHISPEEQLRRFEAREQQPWKRYKITDEDYRNRDKWSDYESAADDMIERTSTAFAPWTLVEANDKRYARIQVLKALCERLEEALP